ncbi:MAG TPA: F0F1 ATP synthase subunit epsilon [Gammaproteobacteria bacterium]|nr:F0F1 ATP synthase subunit epsilon [Gammaproteobacteria bacterium]
MAMTMHVDVVSAEGEIFSGTAEEVFVPAEMGEIGVMPRHTPLISRLKPGEVRVKLAEGGESTSIFVSGGMVEIQPHVVTVLADTGIRAQDLDEAKALEAKKRAEEAMQGQEDSLEFAKARSELVEAMAQLALLEELRKRAR